jgi:tight adherence protein C
VNREWLLAAAGAATLLLVVSAYALMRLTQHQQRFAARVLASRGLAPLPTETRQEIAHRTWMRVVAALGQIILRTGLLSARTRAGLEETLKSAGLPGRNRLELFIGGKICLLLGLPFVATLMLRRISAPSTLSFVIPVAAAVVGLLLPDMVVRYRYRQYIKRVERGLPDALDLLVICSQAGLGLNAAIARVAEEMRNGNQDIGRELAQTANELELMADSRQALQNMGSRTGIKGLVRLGTTLVQSMQYGTPLSESMRVLSAEMRQDMLTLFEARAGRIGVLLTLPMVVFILPCVFLVVGGPAVVQVLHIGGP